MFRRRRSNTLEDAFGEYTGTRFAGFGKKNGGIFQPQRRDHIADTPNRLSEDTAEFGKADSFLLIQKRRYRVGAVDIEPSRRAGE